MNDNKIINGFMVLIFLDREFPGINTGNPLDGEYMMLSMVHVKALWNNFDRYMRRLHRMVYTENVYDCDDISQEFVRYVKRHDAYRKTTPAIFTLISTKHVCVGFVDESSRIRCFEPQSGQEIEAPKDIYRVEML